MKEDRSHWITKEQLDIPLCDIFAGTKTNGTARLYVGISETLLGLEQANLEDMTYEEMNRYIDFLDSRIESQNA